MEKVIATYQGKDSARHRSSEMTVEGDYTRIVEQDYKERTEIEFRNVGNKNVDASIQFIIKKYKGKTMRLQFTSFSIPLCMAKLFIERLSTEK